MNTNESARLAAAVSLLRPDWPTDSLQTFIARNLNARPYQDVAVALAYIATDPTTKTPARVLSAGPWWRVGAEDREPERARRCQRCRGMHLPSSPCDDKPAATAAGYLAQLRATHAEGAA